MRIAILHPTYWPEVYRGAERLVHDLALELSNRGHAVTVLTTHAGAGRTVQEAGVTVRRARRPPGKLLERRGLEPYVQTLPGTVAALARGGFDVAHAFSHVDGYAAARARSLGGPPSVLSLMGIPDRRSVGLRRLRRRLLVGAVRGAAATTVLSRAAAAALQGSLGVEPHVIHGAVSCAAFAPGSARAPRPTLVCTAALNDPRKRGDLLVRAFAGLRRRRHDARLELVGPPDPQHAGGALRLPEGAEHVVPEPPEAVASAYSRAWACVLPAVDEAFGVVLVESLAAGTPVVAARSGAGPEIVTVPGIGRLFEPDDERDLVRALEEALDLAETPGTREACLTRAHDFDWSRVVPRYEELYARARISTR